MKKPFYAVILSGGKGERFWPLSTPDKPKQFLSVFGGKSLIRQAMERLLPIIPKSRILIITSKDLLKATYKELPEIPKANIIAEPCRRDTAAAVATACGIIEKRSGEEAVGAILTADHLMADEEAFRKVLIDAVRAARETDNIVTMGVNPSYPATGFGYIKVKNKAELKTDTTFFKVHKFVEKPNNKTAKRYFSNKSYVWNAGMFVWSVKTMKSLLMQHTPELAILEANLKDEKNTAEVLSVFYPQLTPISFDYAIMEKTKKILVSKGDFGWDDVGTWTSADKHMQIDGRGNAVRGDVTLLDVSDSVILSDGPCVATLGLKNIVIVATKDSILVASKTRVQDLKSLIARIHPGNDETQV
ncbi:MAG: mannose-1-phosphate guanylyltransferase [Kiritimatiellae bacterium]|nr:mannose-1-phosphate guanylyltransferase [Kiritimatiellia bacterium]